MVPQQQEWMDFLLYLFPRSRESRRPKSARPPLLRQARSTLYSS